LYVYVIKVIYLKKSLKIPEDIIKRRKDNTMAKSQKTSMTNNDLSNTTQKTKVLATLASQ
jgi:hypothetical protein